MSSPISSITDARLPGLQSTSSTSGSAGRRLSSQLAGVEIGQSDINEMQTGQMQLAMVRAAVLTINVNQFEAAFEQVMKTATTVDPATGHREMTATADSKLSDALQNLLLASGFTEQQAQAASASFAEQLAKGGSISLSASFAATSTNTVTVSGFSKAIIGNVVLSAGNGTTMSASVTSVVTRAGSVSITFDPDSGALSVSLESHTVSAGSSIFAAATLDTRATSLPPGNTTTVGQHPNSDGTNDDKDSHLRGLIAGLANPALHDASTALDLLRIAASAAQTKNAAKDAGTEPGDRVRNHAKPVTVTVGFTQPLSIASHGENGNRAALFKRPDGSTGVVSFSPVNVEA
ncbi:hypothetical protein [Paraburkholderia rhizosphaerae]|uniref:Uncharacterized protein n=1 Tax=Paraburkholderia rhizosphaerae TaxID=480658 RepID=A0A4R8LLB6_9BURK|nr:hypothetical protein [Paraburkholderia rhizosphaerae]TDY43351.1 hypothetical protein BX592_118146 [Paraburkholderia rhizosphaerae]